MVRIVGEAGGRTPNVVNAEGKRSYVFCGADILLTGLHQDVKGEAACPICGAKTSVEVQGGRMTSVPETALLHYVIEDRSRFSICCEETFIFDREACLKEWMTSYQGPPGKVSSLPDFMAEAISRRGGQSKSSTVRNTCFQR